MRYLILALLALVALPAGATDYYFSTDGSDGANGLTPATAKQSLSALSTLVNSASPGDNFYLQRGDVWQASVCGGCGSGALAIESPSGTFGNPITIGAYDSGARPIIRNTLAGESAVGVIQARAPDYVTITGIRIECSTGLAIDDRALAGIKLVETFNPQRSDYFVVDDVEIANCRAGLDIQGAFDLAHEDDGYVQNFQLINSLIQENQKGMGLFMARSHFALVEGNEFNANGEPGNDRDHQIYSASANDDLVVRNNEFHSGTSGVKQTYGDNIVYEDNLIRNMTVSCYTAGGDKGNTLTNLTIRRNTVHSCGSQAVFIKPQNFPEAGDSGNDCVEGFTIENNVVYGPSASGGIALDEQGQTIGITFCNFTNGTIQHNTIVMTSSEDLGIDGGVPTYSNITIRNNIFAGSGTYHADVGDDADLANIAFSNNLYTGDATSGAVRAGASTYGTCAAAEVGEPGDFDNCVDGPANFTNAGANDYTLTASSTNAIDINLSVGASEDLDQLPRPVGAGYDAGAYEFGATPAAPGSKSISGSFSGSFN